MTIALLTPTGTRHQAFALCENWILRQSYRDFKWFITDDGVEPTIIIGDIRQTIQYLPSKWVQGSVTLHANLKALCGMLQASIENDNIQYTRVFIIEDDEWYHRQYLEKMLSQTHNYLLGGEGWALYYNLQTRTWKRHKNTDYACLCRTSFDITFMDTFIKMLDEPIEVNGKYLDLRLWGQYGTEGKIVCNSQPLSVGIKGMPGRKNINTVTTQKGYVTDTNKGMLQRFLGADSVQYHPYTA